MVRRTWTIAAALVALLSVPDAAHGLVTNLITLQDIVTSEPMIFVVKVEKIYPEKPGVVFKTGEVLKGKVPFDRMPINLTGSDYAQKNQHTPQLLKRLAPDLNVIVFAHKVGKDGHLAFVYSNGTWFGMTGQTDNNETVKWSFTNCEPYLRRTFKGTTEELKQIVVDALAKKKAPPPPDAKEPPGLGPEIKVDEKPKEKPNAKGGPVSLPFAVIAPFVLIGPLAILALLFPTVFGGLALLMKRWTAALSISSLVSTIYFLQMWFMDRLTGTWWATAIGLWITLTAVSLLGALWSGTRYRKALRDGDFETYHPRKWDFLTLIALSLAGLGGVGYAAIIGKNLLQSPWLDLVVSCMPVWVATAALLFVRSGPEGTAAFSLEGAFLWGLVFACANVVALEAGRGAGGIPMAAGGRRPQPVGMTWKFEPAGDGLVYSNPALVGDRLYVSASLGGGFRRFGSVFCLNANTGAEIWHFDNDEAMKIVFSSPCVADGKLFIGEGFHENVDCKLFCLDAMSGKKLWEFPTSSHTESTPCVVNGKVYFGAGDDGIFCLNAADGTKVWNFPGVHVDAPPVVENGRLYVGSGVGDKFNTTLVLCVDADKGTEIWKVPVEHAAFAPPLVADGRVYVGIGNGNFVESAADPKGALLCLDAATGKRIWRRDLPDTVLSKPAVDSRAIYITARDKHCYSLSRDDGRVLWKQSFGAPLVASPILVGEEGEFGTVRSLYVAATNGRVACLKPETGEAFWSMDVAKSARLPATDVSSTPVIEIRKDGASEKRRIFIAANVFKDPTKLWRVYCFEDEIK